MIKQTIVFSNPASLSLRYGQLVIKRNDNEDVVTRPIEDIGFVIIQDPKVTLTVPLINELANNNVAVIYCDAKSMPSSLLIPFSGNTTMQETYRLQIEATLPTKKRIWREIVEGKIKNQASVLDLAGKDGKLLAPYYNNVLSDDSTNREGAAARVYWKALFGRNFVRDIGGDVINPLLNYGYSILRSAVSRAIVGSGLLPALGVHHRNKYNSFALSDDLMEPYRPFVDSIVLGLVDKGLVSISKETKTELLRVLFCDVEINGRLSPLEVALSSTTASLVRVFKDNKAKLRLPKLIT